MSISLSLCFHVSMSPSPCLYLHASISMSLSQCLHVSMFSEFRKRITEVTENGKFRLISQSMQFTFHKSRNSDGPSCRALLILVSLLINQLQYTISYVFHMTIPWTVTSRNKWDTIFLNYKDDKNRGYKNVFIYRVESTATALPYSSTVTSSPLFIVGMVLLVNDRI